MGAAVRGPALGLHDLEDPFRASQDLELHGEHFLATRLQRGQKPFQLFFAPYYYIHGSPHVQDLGRPASHGCVRMMNHDVIELARLVHARNGGSVSDAEITRLLAHPSQTRASRIATPVPLTLRYDPIVIAGDTLRIYKDVYSRSRVHTEGVIQALIAAGYDPASIDGALHLVVFYNSVKS